MALVSSPSPYSPVSQIMALVLYIGTALLISHGYGHHLEFVSMPDLIELLKLNVMVNIAGFSSLAFSRTSIGIFLLRLVYPIKRLAVPIYIGLAVNTIQAICLIIWVGIRCVPLSKQWDPTKPGFCINGTSYTIVERFFGWYDPPFLHLSTRGVTRSHR